MSKPHFPDSEMDIPAKEKAECQPSVVRLTSGDPLYRWLSRDPAVLDYFAGDVYKISPNLWSDLEELRQGRGDEFYSDLLYSLTRKKFPAPEAKPLWDDIITHKYYMSQKVGHNVGITIAVLDYLDNHSGFVTDLKLLPESDLHCLLLFVNEDGLTNVYNHRYFQEALRDELDRCQRYHREFSLLFLDLDHFKEYNDQLGHMQGDVLLRKIADFFKQNSRAADTIARYGGDEFAFILPETNRQDAGVFAQRLHTNFQQHFAQEPRTISISIGVASYPEDGQDSEQLIEAVDQALYHAKRAGRDRIHQQRASHHP